MNRADDKAYNRLLAALTPSDFAMLSSALEVVTVKSGQTLFEPGDDVNHIYFPQRGVIGALILDLRGGVSAEAAMIGFEGAVGGIISEGSKPAFTRGVMAVGGTALRLSPDVLEKAKLRSSTLRDHFARYADCLLSQVLQSVACNAVHGFDARLARWLLTIQDRTGGNELHLTQGFISQMLAVQRPYTTRVVGRLENQGAIRKARGVITVVDRGKLEREACECYAYLRRHFERSLPGVYPSPD